MSWQCLCEGATGLVYYTWEEMDTNPGLWETMKRVAAEIKSRSPILLSADPAPTVEVTGGSWLHWLVRRYQGKVYLFVVNDGDGEGAVTVALPKAPAAVTALGETRAVPVCGRGFTEAMERLGVRGYVIEE